MKLIKHLIFIFAVLFIVTGCENDKEAINWVISQSFKAGDLTLYGIKDKVGLIKMNGNEEKLFIANTGGLYYVYFWGNGKELKGKYKLLATNKETGEQIKLYEWPIEAIKDSTGADASSGGKYSLPQSGLWKLDFYIADEFFDTIIVNAENKS
ncbi:hypothetical protein EHS13_33295 [Paenibacillus psychroresistens]|uniref:DUF4871 domain-containing protein n=1 Tax=Paenibacillus psychroresistens TaxID=1778678 RepID=A0A6B8RVD7_9BACL|nr:hypothetical protein [Paenibacillus psychroresistens]QGQ99393.1 hypothetical protein EHS13_33295 [Paenibacillus psychroresistens]